MGNRAVIKFEDTDKCVYLQWNGGRDSVSAFLSHLQKRYPTGLTGRNATRAFYYTAKVFFGLEYFHRNLNAYVDDWDGLERSNPGDNGIYQVNPKTWAIQSRWTDNEEQLNHPERGIHEEIDKNRQEIRQAFHDSRS